ncbi:rhodanese-like domain-containing protein [Nakamurella aerolata]|uniref:Rhodanese-like domain-containing protein n=1 Tax=Nakamurella aerolata TaxID=1656892 RepID=A0A849ABP9_9ACTN|nr:rhodanese-like domain-containing protein [Nakamurella aerolata]NNG37016.1 rhodanese-like domain-containing protein [Nakamurella aerolata]
MASSVNGQHQPAEIALADLPTDLPAGAALLDVREDDEWQAGHAPQAVHIPLPQLAERLDEVPEGDPVYVVCRSGGRSARATAFLNANGWDAVNVAGGMSAWAAAGRPLTADSADAEPTVI